MNLHLMPPGASCLAQRALAKQALALPRASLLLCFHPKPNLQQAAPCRTFLSGQAGKIHRLWQQTQHPRAEAALVTLAFAPSVQYC